MKIDDYTCIPSTLQRILIGHLLLCEIQDLYKYSQQPIFLLPARIVLVFNVWKVELSCSTMVKKSSKIQIAFDPPQKSSVFFHE